ncbi:hypothetical protein NQ317_008553 [Molorchus minor]|uniref:Trissin n=1 Tax=Molorchus minor TaxID=1323400 RepID=A0ABQ9JRT5_9CUCU|nr:hypothetical protein NQ317_008553 [Molorchus minor]
MVEVTMTKELIALLFILGVIWCEAQSCGSCGSECQSACGTRHFRTCCFNYLKKRSTGIDSIDPHPLAMDPSLRLELWLAKSKYPYLQQHNFLDDSSEVPRGVEGSRSRESERN